jgi:peptidoglycan lytic transglycosylase G
MTRAHSSGGCLIRLMFALLLVAAIGLGALYYSVSRPYQGFQKPVILDFPRGTSTQSMSAQLARAGVIRNSWTFLLARAAHPKARLLAGEYQFSEPASVLTVFNRIARGDVFFYELTVPEGSNMFDIAASIDRFDFMKGADFLRVARDPAPIRDLAPGAPTLEGYLFPSTYRIERRTTVKQLARMMTDLFRKHWRELQPSVEVNPAVNSTVTLASLVEKETALAEERPLVASVYANRLRMGMPLDCDPTTIYAALLEGRYRGTIYRSDLDSQNPYNTYRHPGLPPGPIANPGLAALKAALAPAATSYVYFVARPDGSGGHQFSENIEAHNRAVEQYRQHRR